MTTYPVHPIGFIRSPLKNRKGAPRQGNEGAPNATLELLPEFADALLGLKPGDELIVITFLHESRRETLQVHPRGQPPLTGVFATRSPDRPNPLGLHPVTLLDLKNTTLHLSPIEAIDGTPVLDIKPVLRP